MSFKEFLKLREAAPNPLLRGVATQVGQQVANAANAPTNKDKTAGEIAKNAMVQVAKGGKAAEIEALTQAAKGPAKLGTSMMKKK